VKFTIQFQATKTGRFVQVFPNNLLCRGAVGALTFFSMLAGCASLPPAQKQELIRASELYTQGRYHSAAAILDKLIDQHDQAPEIAEAHYLRGLCQLKGRIPQYSADDFKQAIRKSQRKDLTARSNASLAALAYKEGEWKQASDLYAEALPGLPDRPPKNKILFSAGLCLQRIGKWKEARSRFNELLHKFGSGPLAEDARRMVSWDHPYYAIQVAAFSNANGASRMVQNLRQEGLDATQEYLPRNGRSLWIVMAGHYPTYKDAVLGLKHVKRSYPDAFIIP
jgi:tetratricopeptide (TPR) repeat protein